MLSSALVSALVSGFVIIVADTFATWRKARDASAKRKATLAAKRVAVRVPRIELRLSRIVGADRQRVEN